MEPLKLKPEVKKQWTEALRSGNYKQTSGMLKGDIGFCCLGVLCDIHSKTEDGLGWSADAGRREYGSGNGSGVPPERVMEWATENYADQDHSFTIDDGNNLASKNDGGATFAEIADIIDKEF